MEKKNNEIKMSVGTMTDITLQCSKFPPGLWKAVVAEQQRLARLLDMNSPYKMVFRTVPGNWNFPIQSQALGRLNRGMSPFTPWDTDPLRFFFDARIDLICEAMGIDHKLLEETSHSAFSMACDSSVIREREESDRLYCVSRRPGKTTMALQHRSEARTISASLLYSGLEPEKILVVNPKPSVSSSWEKELEDFTRTFEGTFTCEDEKGLEKFVDSIRGHRDEEGAPGTEGVAGIPDPSFWKSDTAKAIPYMMWGESWEQFHERIGYPLSDAQIKAHYNQKTVESTPYIIPHYPAKPEANLTPASKRKTLLRKSRKLNRTARKKNRG